MKDIYIKKKNGATLRELAKEYKVSESLISRRLNAYCNNNNLTMPKNKAGRKAKEL